MPKRLTRLALAVVLLLVSLTLAVPVHAEEVPKEPAPTGGSRLQNTLIDSAPLSIQMNTDMSIGFTLNGYTMYYADFDAGTYLVVDGVVYGPEPVANRGFEPIAYTEVSQTAGGSGTASDPFTITTEVAAGSTGISLVQVVTYVAGAYGYDVDISVENTNTSAQDVAIIHAADMYANFADNYADFGYGFREPTTGAVGLISLGLQNIQALIPSPNTPPDAYQVSDWGRDSDNIPFWEYIGGEAGEAGPGLGNFVDFGYYDVVAGMQWNLAVPAAVTTTGNSTAALTPGQAQIGLGGGFGTPAQVGIPTPPVDDAPTQANPAEVSVIQRTSPSLAAAPSSLVTYTIVATNRGDGSAKDVIITMPFDGTKLKVVDASFSREGAWVSALSSNSLEIRTGSLGSEGDSLVATVRMQVLPTVAPGTSLASQLSYRWSDAVSGGADVSNTTVLVAAASESNPKTYPLSVDPAEAATGSTLTFGSGIFAPHEPVGIWWNLPDGKVEAGPTFFAEDDGSLAVIFDSGDLPAGSYSMVFYGHWTEFTAVAPFTLK